MSVTYVGTIGAALLRTHTIYRITVVPANSLIGAAMSRWSEAAWGVFEEPGPLCYPAQGEPAILDTSSGKAATFDVALRWSVAGGKTVQTLAQSVTDAYPTTRVARVEAITARVAVLPERAEVQTTDTTRVVEEVRADSALTVAKDVGKAVVVALLAGVVLYALTKVPKV